MKKIEKSDMLKSIVVIVAFIIFVVGIVVTIMNTGDTFALSASDYYCESGDLISALNSYYCCPKGYSYDKENNNCAITTALIAAKVKDYSCASGSVISTGTGKYCCPSGTSYDSSTNKCSELASLIAAEYKYSCSSGSVISSVGSYYCCPSGYSYTSGSNSCTRSVAASSYSDATSACGSDTLANYNSTIGVATCSRGMSAASKRYTCDEGDVISTGTGNYCCPVGTTYSDDFNKCIKSTTNLVASSPSSYTCDEGDVISTGTGNYCCPVGTTYSDNFNRCIESSTNLIAALKKEGEDGPSNPDPGDNPSQPEEPETYTISYDANGGSGAPASQTKTEGTDLTLSSTVPTRDDYTFVGWNTDKNATTATYQPGGKYTADSSATLYAIWKKNESEAPGTGDEEPETYTISYDANGGSGAPASQTKTKGTDLTLSSIVPTREGYTFVGWNTDVNATTATYQPGGKYTTDSSATLYAIWEKDEPSDSDNPDVPSDSDDPTDSDEDDSKTDEELDENEKTGDILITMVWIIGLGALGYSVYYFMKKKNII